MKYPALNETRPILASLAKENVDLSKKCNRLTYPQRYLELKPKFAGINLSVECVLGDVMEFRKIEGITKLSKLFLFFTGKNEKFHIRIDVYENHPDYNLLRQLDKGTNITINLPYVINQAIEHLKISDVQIFEKRREAERNNEPKKPEPEESAFRLFMEDTHNAGKNGFDPGMPFGCLISYKLWELELEVNGVKHVISSGVPTISSSLPTKKELIEKSGCFIATAATGSYEHPMVEDLRVFRDQILLPSRIGSRFVNLYYKNSPRVADYIEKDKISRFLTRNLFVRPLAFIARFFTR